MTLSRAHLQKLLNNLEDQLPAMIRELPDPADFWQAFAGQADVIADAAAGPEEFQWVQNWLEGMLLHLSAPDAA